jgi:type IV secretory pathway VirB2 component (pilin)
MNKSYLLRIASSILCALALLILTFAPAAANGTPIKVFLNYLPEVSNYGSTEATGIGLVSIGEGWIDLTAVGLPALDGEMYEAWLLTSQSGQAVSLGKFNADDAGLVTFQNELENPLPEFDYRYLVISVEPIPDPDLANPDLRRTISGVLPSAEIQITTGGPTPTSLPGVTPTPPPPETLPVTGKTAALGWIVAGITLAFGLTLSALGWWMKTSSHETWESVPIGRDSTNANKGDHNHLG